LTLENIISTRNKNIAIINEIKLEHLTKEGVN